VNGTYKITATAHDTSGNVNATSTVINVQNLLGDINGDGTVNIIDVAIVARAFGSKRGDETDLNNDGIINIIDISLVAREFGKTV
jgi:hypothetical protein